MIERKGAYYKAWLLLIVFSLNTVVSFACSLNGFFHSLHHSNAAPSKQHDHSSAHGHGHGKEHHPAGNAHHQQENPGSTESSNDDCCSRFVVEVEKTEKSVSRSIGAPDAVFLTSFIASFPSLFSLLPLQENTSYPPYVRWRLPSTIQDLRIVIQSFQI